MKRFTALVLLIAMLLCACSGKDKPETDPSSTDNSAITSSEGYVKPTSDTVINVPSEDSDDWALFLVNNYFALPSAYSPKTVEVEPDKPFHAKAADDFKSMLYAASNAGETLYVVSTYRTIDYQRDLFERDVQKYKDRGMTESEARAETAKNIAKPGKSEHNTGLAVDLVSADWFYDHDDLTEEFEDTKAFEWLSAHAHEYGFILRYPKGKEEITEITYEPWHYRYVGKKHAKAIRESGLTLEEYMLTVQK